MLIQAELATNERSGIGITVNDAIVPGQKRIERDSLAPLRMHDFVRTATRKQDQVTGAQFQRLRTLLTHKSMPFRREMEHHGIARLHREPPWRRYACAYQHQTIRADRFQPPVQRFHRAMVAE
jgi:hypothetical protein